MREYELIIDEALKNGLYSDRVPFNTQALSECLGFRCGKFGLEAAQIGYSPLPAALDMHYSWPFPQLILGDTYNFLIVRDIVGGNDHVYIVSDDYSTFTLIVSLSHATYGFGSLMSVADFGEYVFMTNGAAMIYWNVALSAWSVTAGISTIPRMGAVCNYNGQVVGGNIKSVWYDCDETFYVWSKIGSINFVPGCDNESGYRRCPYGGEVYHTKMLGSKVIGYSSKGLTVIKTAIVGDCGPAVTGFDKLFNIGPVNIGAIDGDENSHLFVGSDLIVRTVTQEGIKELGYRHWMQQIDSEDILVMYDKSNHDFYIGNSIKTYLLTHQGLTEIMQHPSAVWRTSPDYIYMLPFAIDNSYPIISTVPFDMGFKGHKTTSVVESDAFSLTYPEVAVDYTYDQVGWVTTPFTPMNNLGIATIVAAGNAFRFKLRFDTIDENFSIGFIKPRYKMTDLRGIRGVYAPPPRGQS